MKNAIRILARWVLKGVVWTSAFLFLATAATWVRGFFFANDTFFIRMEREPEFREVSLDVCKNGIYFQFSRYEYFKTGEKNGVYVSLSPQEYREVSDWRKRWVHYVDEPYFYSIAGRNYKFKMLGMGYDTHELNKSGISELLMVSAMDCKMTFLAVPFWMMMVLFAAIPGWTLGAWVIQKRKKMPGHCIQCGYDLRAHQAGQKCPECGRVIEAIEINCKT